MQDAASCYRMGMTEFAPNAIDIKKTSAQACEPANRKTKQNKLTTPTAAIATTLQKPDCLKQA